MEVRIKNDSVEVDGYVNAIERKSNPLNSRIGKFVERIKKGAFKRAIDRNDNIRILLNHNWEHDLGGTKDGNLKLMEDNIGLRAMATITDPDVVEKARNGDLVGWSFGFTDRDVDTHDEDGMTTRDVKDLDLYEVSLLDRTKTPAYDGTLVSVRDNENILHGSPCITEIETRDDSEPKGEPKGENPIDYSKYETMIEEMKGEKK